MWKNIKNVVAAVSDLVVIGAKEVNYQANKASDATEQVTGKLAERSAQLRAQYEADLADRKSGIKKPVIVPEAATPTDVIPVN